MAWANSLQVALKEWAVVCAALGSGRQIILLRKGGIYESGGEFEIEHRQFLLFPTYVHQNAAMLKEEAKGKLTAMTAEPRKITISLAAQITDIIPMPERATMEALNDEHIWTAPLIDMRFNYRPENPLYLLLVRLPPVPAGHERQRPILRRLQKLGSPRSRGGNQKRRSRSGRCRIRPPPRQSVAMHQKGVISRL